MIVVCVLKSGGEYGPEHVIRLRDQVLAHLPGARFFCMSDIKVAGVKCLPLVEGLPGWWAKMEMFHPKFGSDFLYLDLDTSVVGDLSEIAGHGRLAIMRDVYRPMGLQSSVMFLTEQARLGVWQVWNSAPASHWMTIHRKGGDQAFLERFWLEAADRWQDVLPGQIVSYKADRVGATGVPDGARLVVFHGRPRPWQVGW